MQRKIRFAFIQRSLNLAFPNQTVADDFFIQVMAQEPERLFRIIKRSFHRKMLLNFFSSSLPVS